MQDAELYNELVRIRDDLFIYLDTPFTENSYYVFMVEIYQRINTIVRDYENEDNNHLKLKKSYPTG